MNVVLVMFRENGERRSFSLTRDVTVVGRREDAHFRIPLTDVSRKHCRLVKDGHTLRVEDLGSSNGTYHNGQRVQEAEIRPGDTLRIGPVQFIVQIDGVPADADLGSDSGSGLEDSAATMVTPAFSPPPPPPPPLPPMPPGFAPPGRGSQQTVDDTPEEVAGGSVAEPGSSLADDFLIDDGLPSPEPVGEAEVVAESTFGESGSAEAPEAGTGPQSGAGDDEVSLERTDDDLAELPQEEDLPDFEVSPPTAPREEPSAAEVAEEVLSPGGAAGAEDVVDGEEVDPHAAEHEPIAADDLFAITDDDAPAGDEDVLIDFDLPDDKKQR